MISELAHRWDIVIFASRESLAELIKTVDATLISAEGLANIQVIVNGNMSLARDLTDCICGDRKGKYAHFPASTLNVWFIPLGDKANAWNQYIHRLWHQRALAFFIDGYVRLNADALQILGAALEASPSALGGTGVPSMGRSAKQLRETMLEVGGLHGNFVCLKGAAIQQLRKQNIRLPVGLYRVDSLMGANLSYAFDPAANAWSQQRIVVQPDATWRIDPARWWRWNDLMSYFRRYIRQQRGTFENAAIAEHLARKRRHPSALPENAYELVHGWATTCHRDFQDLVGRNLFLRYAFKTFQPIDVSEKANLLAQHLYCNDQSSAEP